MKKTKQKRLAVRLTVIIVGALFLCLAALVIIISVKTSGEMMAKQVRELELMSQTNATTMKAYMERVADKQGAFSATLKAMQGNVAANEALLLNMLKEANNDEDATLNMFIVLPPSAERPEGETFYSTYNGTGKVAGTGYFLTNQQYETLSNGTALMIADPHEKTIDNQNYQVITVMTPVTDGSGAFLGGICSDVETSILNDVKYESGGYETFYNMIICGHETVIVNTKNVDTVGDKYVDVARSTNPDLVLETAKRAEKNDFVDENQDGTKDYRVCSPFYVGNAKTVWISVASVEEGEFRAVVNEQTITVVLVGLLTLILLAILSFLTIRRALRPIAEIEHAAKEMAQGDLKAKIVYTGSDEIGSLAESMRTSMQVIESYIVDIDRAMGEMANGNFDLAPSQPFIGDFENIEKSITKFIMSISATLKGISEAADQVSVGSGQLSDGAQSLAQGATEQASSVEELSAEITEFERHIKSSAESAEMAKQKVGEAGAAVEESSAKMDQLTVAIQRINEKSTQISKIIKTIEDIAFQTNILALNAAVEAARAGEAGKGFTVVAEEVRTLASKSAEAAKNTNSLIEETVKAVAEGSQIAEGTAQSMATVVERAQVVTELIDKITSTTMEQARSMGLITTGVNQIASVISTNSATAEESAASSQELSGQAHMLREYVGHFKVKGLTSTNEIQFLPQQINLDDSKY